VKRHWARDFFTYPDAMMGLSILVTSDSSCACVKWWFFPLMVSFLFFNRINIREVGAALVGKMPCMGVAGSTSRRILSGEDMI
jgi:hypothetical protein